MGVQICTRKLDGQLSTWWAELELTARFDAVLHVPLLSPSEISTILSEVFTLSPSQPVGVLVCECVLVC